ncbi:MAG: hypothetical protein AAGG51_13455 [Cyanobacteria bacterium P01_G01_bin.54]
MQQDPEQTYATYTLAQMLLNSFEAQLLTLQDPLNLWQFIQIEKSRLLMESALTLDPSILIYLLGEFSSDPALQGIVYPVHPDPNSIFPPSYQDVLSTLHQHLTQPAASHPPLIQLQGGNCFSHRQLAIQVAQSLSVPIEQLNPASLPTEPQLGDRLRRRWERFSRLTGAILFIEIKQRPTEFDAHQFA